MGLALHLTKIGIDERHVSLLGVVPYNRGGFGAAGREIERCCRLTSAGSGEISGVGGRTGRCRNLQEQSPHDNKPLSFEDMKKKGISMKTASF